MQVFSSQQIHLHGFFFACRCLYLTPSLLCFKKLAIPLHPLIFNKATAYFLRSLTRSSPPPPFLSLSRNLNKRRRKPKAANYLGTIVLFQYQYYSWFFNLQKGLVSQRKMMAQPLLQIWVVGFQGTITHSSPGLFVMREDVVSGTCHLWCLLQGRQGFVTLDMTITNPTSWKLVSFVRNHLVTTETSSCTGQELFSVLVTVDFLKKLLV